MQPRPHKTKTELWATERNRDLFGEPKRFVRWCCSCGRIGPAIPIGEVKNGKSAERRASDGGVRHVAAMERGA